MGAVWLWVCRYLLGDVYEIVVNINVCMCVYHL